MRLDRIDATRQQFEKDVYRFRQQRRQSHSHTDAIATDPSQEARDGDIKSV
jgi:hypothetical protein